MNHCRRSKTDRDPIITHTGSNILYVITIAFFLGSIAFACSEDNVSDAGNEGIAGNVNAATNAETAGDVNPATDVGNPSAVCPNGNYWDISYDLPKSEQTPGVAPADPPVNQNALLLRDTMMAIGDGNHNIGPGNATIRFENIDGKPGGKAYLLEFTISIDFTAPPATTNLVGTMGHDYEGPCGSCAVGNIEGDKLTWSDFAGTAYGTDQAPNVHSFFSEGTITCDGPLCGSFGAPPQGTTPNSDGPYDLRFETWILAADASTFFAPPFITQQDLNSTTRIQVYGVEKSRECKSFQACE